MSTWEPTLQCTLAGVCRLGNGIVFYFRTLRLYTSFSLPPSSHLLSAIRLGTGQVAVESCLPWQRPIPALN